MVQIVTDSDGTVHQFPDDATPEEMKAILGTPPGFWARFGHGMGDTALATGRLISKVGEAEGWKPLIPSKTIEETVARRETGYRAPEGMDWARIAGRTAAALPAAAIPGGPIASGIASGAASAAVEPVPPDKPYWSTLAKQAVGGAAIGGALGTFSSLLGQIGKRSPNAFNQQALKEAAPAGFEETINSVGHEGVDQLRSAFNSAYEKVLPGLKANIDDQLISDLQAIRRGMPANGATKTEIEQFQTIVDAQILGRSADTVGTMIEGKQAQNAQSMLGQMAAAYARDPSVDKQTLGRALGEARDALLGAFQRANPEAADTLAGIGAKYPALLAVQKAAAAASANEGVFKPKQLLTAIKSTDRTRAKSITASGNAPLQATAEEAAKAKVGEPSLIERSLNSMGFGGGIGGAAYGHPEALLAVPAANLMREAVQTPAAVAVSNAIPPIVKAATPAVVNVLGNTPPGRPASAGGGAPNPSPAAPPAFDIENFLKANPPGQNSSNVDQFFKANPPKGSPLAHAIEQQESGGRNVISPAGAVGPMQIMPDTWRRYAKPGEDIHNPSDNRAVGQRIVAALLAQYGDPRMVAAAYFSGRPDFQSSAADVTGKKTSSYVADVMRRIYG